MKRKLLKDKDDADGLVELDATFTWNTAACGEWGDKGSLNKMYYWPWAIPHLVLKYRKSENSRIFFASWESYFLLAEAALKGWSVPMAPSAYEQVYARASHIMVWVALPTLIWHRRTIIM